MLINQETFFFCVISHSFSRRSSFYEKFVAGCMKKRYETDLKNNILNLVLSALHAWPLKRLQTASF